MMYRPDAEHLRKSATGGHRSVLDIARENPKRMALCVCLDCGTTWVEGATYVPPCSANAWAPAPGKIIAITPERSPLGMLSTPNERDRLVLCDDGSVWRLDHWATWERMPYRSLPGSLADKQDRG